MSEGASRATASVGTRSRSPWVLLLLGTGSLLPLIPYFLETSDYVLYMLMNSVTYAMAVLGMVVVLGYTRQINLAQATFFGFGAYAVALGTVAYGLPFWAAFPIGIVLSAAAGLVLGFTTLRASGHYLAMITISFQQIFDLVAVNWIEVTRGPDGVAGIPRPSLFGDELSDLRAFLLFSTLVLYALIGVVWWLPSTRLGRAMRAVRDNELAAETIGVHALRTKVTAFTMSAMLGGIGGGLYAAGFSYISPENFNFARSVEFLTATLLGGAGSAFGGTLGTVLVVLLPEWLKDLPGDLRFLSRAYLGLYGLSVILIMVFMPEGIWGLLRAAWGKVRRTSVQAPGAIAVLMFQTGIERATPALKLENLQKYFGGLRAVDGVDVEVVPGTVHALIGPNGSGKTTILNVVSGIYKRTAGKIAFDGVDISLLAPHARAGRGMGRTFQNIRLFPSMTALEKVMVGAQRDNNPIEAGDEALRQRALSALEFVGVAHRAHEIVRNLPYGHQRYVEIARALAGHPKLLLLDEPGAGLNQTEKQELVALLLRLRNGGLTIFLIDHDMGFVAKVSDRITALNFGKKIAEGVPQEVLRHPEVIVAYLGKGAAGATAQA